MFTKNSTFAIMKMYMINKGEFYMEYENAEENAKYLQACENVKKIANAIKKIKMKYYTNFAKITNEENNGVILNNIYNFLSNPPLKLNPIKLNIPIITIIKII